MPNRMSFKTLFLTWEYILSEKYRQISWPCPSDKKGLDVHKWSIEFSNPDGPIFGQEIDFD